MGIVRAVKPKTISLGELAKIGAREAARTGVLPKVSVYEDDSVGLIFPCSVRVRTIEGIKDTNYVFVSRAATLKVWFDDGSYFAGTYGHKLMTDKAKDEWTTLENLQVGQLVTTDTGTVTVRSIEQNGVRAVADICVPGPHSYLLKNGVVSHNSLLANELAVNMALNGYKVVVVPLEMSRDEMLGRIAAKVCGVDSTKIITKQLATGEKKLVEEKMDAFMRKVNKRGGRLTVFKPEGGISIEETYAALASLEADVTIVDYISLLEGVDGDDAWQKLGAIARTAKVNADATNRVNILLCQVNDDGTIRYSRAISEHSSNSWIWRTPLEEREKAVGVVQVSQVKARNSKSFNFEVGMEWAYMRLAKVTQEAVTKAEPKKNLADI